MQTRQDFVQVITQHYCVFSVYAEIMQLWSELLGVLDLKKLAKNHPVEFWSLIAANNAIMITVEVMQDIFDVNFHPRGHNNCSAEECAITFLYNYFQDCEGVLKYMFNLA